MSISFSAIPRGLIFHTEILHLCIQTDTWKHGNHSDANLSSCFREFGHESNALQVSDITSAPFPLPSNSVSLKK